MAARQNLEIGGCVVIAVALHLAIGGGFSTGQSAMGANMSGPPPQLAAGSGSMQDLVNQWESPPEAASEPEQQQQPEELTQPELAQPEPEVAPDTAPEAPMAPAAPQLSAAQPNLPEPPEPLPEDTVYPELRTFEPPVFRSELALEESVRPGPKPPKPEPRRQPEPEPQQRQQAQPQQEQPQQQQAQQQPAQQPAQQGGGAGGNAQANRAGGGGGAGGASPQQQANALQQWGGQIASCISSRAGRVAGVRGRASVTLSLNVARNGDIKGVGVAYS